MKLADWNRSEWEAGNLPGPDISQIARVLPGELGAMGLTSGDLLDICGVLVDDGRSTRVLVATDRGLVDVTFSGNFSEHQLVMTLHDWRDVRGLRVEVRKEQTATRPASRVWSVSLTMPQFQTPDHHLSQILSEFAAACRARMLP